MVPGGGLLLTVVRRRILAALLLVAGITWLLARRDGVFSIVGLDGPASAELGPLLPALSAGLTIAILFAIVDRAAGPVSGAVAALVVFLLPDYLPLHRASLTGPPLLTLTVAMLGVMLFAPRFSLAYGTLAAGALFGVSPAALGLPAAAAAWAWLQPRNGRSREARTTLALVPAAVGLLLALLVGGSAAVTHGIGWRGGLDHALGSAGAVVGAQLVPAVRAESFRWFLLADCTLMVVALVLVAWRRAARPLAPGSVRRRLYPAAGVLAAGYATGLFVRTMLRPGAADPGRDEMMPLVVLGATMIVASIAALWPRWPWWGKVLVTLLLLGWMGAAVAA